jgi:hypothetical protein
MQLKRVAVQNQLPILRRLLFPFFTSVAIEEMERKKETLKDRHREAKSNCPRL